MSVDIYKVAMNYTKMVSGWDRERDGKETSDYKLFRVDECFKISSTQNNAWNKGICTYKNTGDLKHRLFL